MIKIGNSEIATFPLMLAPMEDVSDPPFRLLCKELGADLLYTEFISSEGLIRDAQKSLQKLDIYPAERPIGIQIFGNQIQSMREAAQYVAKAKPELLDINYGCPVKNVACKGAGAGILRDIPKMVEMTRAVVEATDLPVTVKTRLGWDEQSINILEVALRLQSIGIKALTIHARTRVQMYKGTADWTWIKKVKELPEIEIPIFGNGDIDSPEKAKLYKEQSGVDGIMIGRAAIGNPWIFNQIKYYFNTGNKLPPPNVSERVRVARQHLLHSVDWKGEKLGIFEMRRHYTPYFKNLPDFKEYRTRLVNSENLSEILDTLSIISEKYVDFTPEIIPLAR
ncbi:MAG: tRNA dihydrouridine synthase DusB [Sphingobacteriia bacterium]|nr:tRNA dihydrouridine synthase DusB [Sphingobacteriia bacterium]